MLSFLCRCCNIGCNKDDCTAPSIVWMSDATGIYEDDTPVTMSVSATGTDLKYQWLFNGIPIIGATSPVYSLIVNNLTAGRYNVVVRNECGSQMSTTKNVSKKVPPTTTTTSTSTTTTTSTSTTTTTTSTTTSTNFPTCSTSCTAMSNASNPASAPYTEIRTETINPSTSGGCTTTTATCSGIAIGGYQDIYAYEATNGLAYVRELIRKKRGEKGLMNTIQ